MFLTYKDFEGHWRSWICWCFLPLFYIHSGESTVHLPRWWRWRPGFRFSFCRPWSPPAWSCWCCSPHHTPGLPPLWRRPPASLPLLVSGSLCLVDLEPVKISSHKSSTYTCNNILCTYVIMYCMSLWKLL